MPIPGQREKPKLSNRLTSDDRSFPPHLMVNALAGTGKTSTIIEGVKYLRQRPVSIEPSDQQLAIWHSLQKSSQAKTIAIVAYNNSAANELKKRVPEYCEACSTYGLGFRAVKMAYGYGVKPDGERTKKIVCQVSGIAWEDRFRPAFKSLIVSFAYLVSTVKLTLADPENLDSLVSLCEEFEIAFETESEQRKAFQLLPEVLQECSKVTDTIDWEDMVWLPTFNHLPMPSYDLLIVDEAQDLSRGQQELVLRAGKRLIFVGDANQSLYAFAGADSLSISRLGKTLKETAQGCETLPLTVTRRCSFEVVERAKNFVPDFQAHPSNSQGLVKQIHGGEIYSLAQQGDFILARMNAPLIAACLNLVDRQIPAVVVSRRLKDSLVTKFKRFAKIGGSESTKSIQEEVKKWYREECKKVEVEMSGKPKNVVQMKLSKVQDQYETLLHFCDDTENLTEILENVTAIFAESPKDWAVNLMTVHAAKGLESPNVFILNTKHHPIQMVWKTSSPTDVQNERNVEYVAITRAIHRLYYVI